MECEIFGTVRIKKKFLTSIFSGTILDEANESYPQEIVHEFSNENHDQMAENVRKITELALKIKKKK